MLRPFPSPFSWETPELPDVDGGLWFFDEGAPHIFDVTGQHDNQKAVGVIWPVVADRFGSALAFTTGTNASYCQVGFSGGSANLGPCTILFLVKRTSTGYGVLWDRSDGNNVNAGIQLCFTALVSDKLQFAVVYATASMNVQCPAPAIGEWHLVGATWTGAQGAGYATYIDGVAQTSTLVVGGTGARGSDLGFIAEIGGTSRTVYVGGAFTSNSLDGSIALAVVDRRVWPEAEIKTFYDGLEDLLWARRMWLPTGRAVAAAAAIAGPLIGGRLTRSPLTRGRLAA